MKVFKVVICILLLPFCAVAQPQLPLPEAVQIAMRENQDIEIARYNTELAETRDNWGMAGLIPSLNANGSYTYSINDITQQLAVTQDTSSRPAVPTTIEGAVSESYNASVTLNYVLFDGFGRINNLRVLGLRKELSETQLRFSIENTLLQVFNTYYNAARQLQQLQVDEEAVQLSLERLERAETAYELGSGNRLQMLNAQVDLNTDSVNYLNTVKDYNKSLRNLYLLLDFPVDTSIVVDTTISIDPDLDYATLQEQALESNAALVQAQFNRRITERNIDIAWSEYAPQISGNAGYNYSRQENEGSFLQLSEQEGWQAGISVQWTLFNGYRNATEIELAKIQLERDEVEQEQAKDQLRVDMAKAWIDYQTNLRILRTVKQNLSVAALNFERSEQSYRLGQINSSQLREAQLNYIRSRVRLTNLKYTLKISEIEMKRIAGVLIQAVAE